MKLASFVAEGRPQLGLVSGEKIASLTSRVSNLPGTMIELIVRWDEFKDAVAAIAGAADYDLADVHLLPPVSRPGKVYALGLNYADHVEESKAAVEPQHYQMWFTKALTSITGPNDPIELPLVSTMLDYECELVIIIGKRCRHVPVEAAGEVIFGFCAGNDVSVRDWQMRTRQFDIGKSFDTHAPIGPWIVTPDELDWQNVGIRTLVNGAKRQESNTRNMIYSCVEQIAYLSQAMTLEPGDILFTGTPSGVGSGMNPRGYLKDGDVVRVEIDGIGSLNNRVVQEIKSDSWAR
jgi:2-keto-4-pentenoate hydratase/2-oxohepta-3-ene-1,7-dioic acid hydratase in catechol pathway